MKNYGFEVTIKTGVSMEAETLKEAIETVKEIFKQENNIELLDKEIKLIGADGGFLYLKDGNNIFEIKSEHDLYLTYTDFVIDHDSGANRLPDETFEKVGYIRDNYSKIFEKALKIKGVWEIKEFEERFGE